MDTWKRIRHLFERRSRVAACLVFIHEDARLCVDVCIIRRDGALLVVEQKHAGLSVHDAKAITGNTPVIISLAGESIIHKKINKAKEHHWSTMIPNVIPKLKLNDFFIQYTPLDEVCGYVSLARKEAIDAITKQFIATGFVIYDFMLAPFALQRLAGVIPDTTLKTSYYEIQISDKKISQLKFASEASVSLIKIGKSVVESDIVIQYASAITFFTNDTAGIEHANVNPAAETRRKFEESFRLKVVTLVGSSILILFLAASALALAMTADRLAKLQKSFGAQARKSQPAENLVIEFSTIRNTIHGLGLASHHYVSFYADRIAMKKPHDVFLTELKIFPAFESTKQTSMIKFNTTTISVSGGCTSNDQLAKWIEELSREQWIGAIQNQNYHRSEQRNSAMFSFDIHVIPQ
jgi:hypothetical protein